MKNPLKNTEPKKKLEMKKREKKYYVVYDTEYGGKGVINNFITSTKAEEQLKETRKSKSFKKLGYKNPRIEVKE